MKALTFVTLMLVYFCILGAITSWVFHADRDHKIAIEYKQR